MEISIISEDQHQEVKKAEKQNDLFGILINIGMGCELAFVLSRLNRIISIYLLRTL